MAFVAEAFAAIRPQQEEAGWDRGFGITVKFTSFPDIDLAIDTLEQKREGIELLSVREVGSETHASVWIPEGKLAVFEKKLADYVGKKKDKNQRPLDNQKFIDAIQDIRTAVIEDLWIDESALPDDGQVTRFEAWIGAPIATAKPASAQEASVTSLDFRIERFRHFASLAGMQVSDGILRFPERAVLQLRGTVGQLRSSAHLLGQLAEIRRAPETAQFFMHLPPNEQREWSEELLRRAQFKAPNDDVPHICILDTGSTPGHPLLADSLDANDVHVVDQRWGASDDHGHGTEQSGLALWGDLSFPMQSNEAVALSHRLESVKLLPHNYANFNEHFGNLTAQAVSLPEISAPGRRRVFSMAITSTETTLRGHPTAWSSEVDAIASDWAGNGEAPRLVVLSAGNVQSQKPGEYPSINGLTSVEDPAQAWNALTIGAITQKVSIAETTKEVFVPLAIAGGLSPFSSTSRVWHREAPFKPDVVFEGGNLAQDGALVSKFDSLSLLTTHHKPAERHLTVTEATSAATALASRFTAEIMAGYPNLWPETIRALTVHSASWTPALMSMYPGSTKDDVENRLRHCGWGEPDLGLALHSGADSLTLVAQGMLQPFEKTQKRKEHGKTKGGNVTARDMHLHKLPWPREALEDLLAENVELRITLSYFIEPNPGERGRSSRFSYVSHGLRFAVQKPAERLRDFQQRVNQLARNAEDGIEPQVGGGDPGWILGFRKRFRGSLHHDRLTCTAAQLASREHIAVFPVGGWWKTREAQERFNRNARYSLVVSIHVPNVPAEIDLYTGVEQAIRAEIAPEIVIGT